MSASGDPKGPIPPRQAPRPDDWPARPDDTDETADDVLEDLRGPTEFGESVD